MSDYDRIRVLWPDHLGLARGKYLPVHLAEQGTGHCITTFALGYDRSLIPAPGAYLLEGLPDVVASFDPDEVRPSWEDDATGVVVGHLDFRGKPYTVSARHALQQALAAWADLGYSPKVGIEFEAYVLQPDGEGGWERWDTPRSFVYGTGRSADPTGLIDDITRTAISHGGMALAANPDEWQRVLKDPGLIDSAAEEILRWATPVMHMRRTATTNTELAGTPIAEGDKVVMWYASANRDEAVFEDPFRFDVCRANSDHLAFGGGGPHLCLGAFLARLEVTVLLEEMAKRSICLEQTSEPVRARSNFVHGVLSVGMQTAGGTN